MSDTLRTALGWWNHLGWLIHRWWMGAHYDPMIDYCRHCKRWWNDEQ